MTGVSEAMDETARQEKEAGELAASISAGLSREYIGDREIFLSLLIESLEPALGERLRVERGGWLRRGGPVRRLHIDLDDDRFALAVGKGGSLTATRCRVVRGIALRTEELTVEAWLQSLAEALAEYGRTHREALEALKRRVW